METRWKAAPWGLAMLVGLLYLPVLTGQILDWDDPTWVADPVVREPFFEAMKMAFGTLHERAWYPLLRMSWWLQHALLGDGTPAMHAVNLGLFIGSIGLLGSLLNRLELDPRAGLVATALWAVHPTRVESVAWLTSRKDLLSLAAVLIAAHLLVAGRAHSATFAFAVGCLCKAAVFPLGGTLAMILWARGKPVGDASGVLGVAGGVAVFGAMAYRDPDRAGYPFDGMADNALFLIGLQGSWWRRLGESELAAVQPFPTTLWPEAVAGVLLLGGACLLATQAKRWGAVLVGLWLLPLLPVHGLVPLPFWGADRHLLFPSIAIAIGLCLGARRWLRWWVPLPLLVPLAMATHQRIPDWHDSLALWTADHKRPGDHWVRGLKLGTALGRVAKFPEAVEAFKESEALEPGRSDLLARRLIAEMAVDGWSSIDAGITRGLQPPPQTAEQWAHVAKVMDQLEHPQTCDASRQAALLGGTLIERCR